MYVVGGGILDEKGGISFDFLVGTLLVSPNISAAFLIKSSSDSELSTLEPFSPISVGGGVMTTLRFDLLGMLSGIVLLGMSVFCVRVLILGRINGIVKSEAVVIPDIDVLSLFEPYKKQITSILLKLYHF